MDTTKPTVVFVHGAWADNSGWDSSIRALRRQGFRAIGAANPLRELRSDAAYVAALLRSIDGPPRIARSAGRLWDPSPAGTFTDMKRPITVAIGHRRIRASSGASSVTRSGASSPSHSAAKRADTAGAGTIFSRTLT
jgi:hypothetical protein